MFRKETVWDSTVMTKGTTVKLAGFSPINNKTFNGLEYKVKSVDGWKMVVQGKNGHQFTIEAWEIGDDPYCDLTIEIINQIPYVMPFLGG